MSGCLSDAPIASQIPRSGFRRGAAWRLFLIVLVVLTTFLGRAVPASAAAIAVTSFRADFDNDGIPDTVTVINDGRSSQVRVWLSHLSRFRVLRIPDEVVAVVATDLNADGRVDVRASTRRKGVFVWLNQGRGHLRRVKPSAPVLTTLNRFGGPSPFVPSSFARWLSDDDPPSGSLPDFERSYHGRGGITRALIRAPDITSLDDRTTTPPRAPPST